MKIISASLIALAFAANSAFAAGTAPTTPAAPTATAGPTTHSEPPKSMTAPTQMHCKVGQVVKSMKKNGHTMKSCVRATSGIIPDDELYAQGYLLAKTGEYDWALSAFNAMTNKQTPETLTMIGYSNRKAGRLEIAVSYYDQALAMQPDYVKAREYLGEGYVAAGRIDLANLQLAEIAKRAGTASEEYVDLAKAIHGQAVNL